MELAGRFHSCPFRDFNTTFKHAMRAMRERHPELDSQASLMLAGYKVVKTVNRRWPQRFFFDAFVAPHRERLAARDEAYFLQPGALQIDGYDELISDVLAVWRRMQPAEKGAMWDAIDALLSKSAACEEARASRAG